MPSSSLGFFTGCIQDYNYMYAGCMEITLELGCCKFPRASTLQNHWHMNRDALVRYLQLGYTMGKEITQLTKPRLPVNFSAYLPTYNICLPICTPVYLYVHLPIYIICVTIYTPVHLYVYCLLICIPAYLYVGIHLSIYMHTCLLSVIR